MRRSTVSVLLLLAACSEYDLKGEDPTAEDPTAEDSGTPPITDTERTDTAPPPEEECNGEDDDLDGMIDEDFPDIDADGIADCVDDDCDTLPPAAGVPINKECVGGESGAPKDPWNAVIKWQWLGDAVQSTPTVGDLDRDGVPEVVFTATSGQLVVLDGATGAVERILSGVDDQSGVALGDIDGDGYGDIVASTGSCFSAHNVVAYDRTGALMWSVPIGDACETYPYIADLEGDGDVEIVVNDSILDGATGAVVANLSGGAGDWGAPVAVDMDGDGRLEILLENRIYDASGAFLWSCGTGAGTGTFPQPVNIDADPEGEVLIAAPGRMTLCDDTGAVLWTYTTSGPYGAPVSVADFDGDGAQEFAIPDYGQLTLVETDGSVRWTTPIQDFSGLAGCTSWDINADGVPEVIYADEQDFIVADGVTGLPVIVEGTHGSVTLAETPSVADVDGDGRGDLLYGSNSGVLGVTVLSSGLDEWPYAPPVYNQYGYYGANISSDLSVPAGAPAPWLSPPNIFRGQPSPVFFEPAQNAGGTIADVCAASCEEGGYAEVVFEVYNDGQTTLAAGTGVEVYALTGGAGTVLYTWAIPIDLEPGESVVETFATTVDDLAAELLLVIDGDELIGECLEDDNTFTFDGVPCH